MPLPDVVGRRLRIPAIVAPMFLTSGPDLVAEVCRCGKAPRTLAEQLETERGGFAACGHARLRYSA